MWSIDTPKTKSVQTDSAVNGIGRRQYLTAVAAMGAASIVPVAAADDHDVDDEELFRETIDEGGGTAAVSKTGNIIAFGTYGGTAQTYIVDDDDPDAYEAVEFNLPEVSRGFTISHVAITEETNKIVAAAMDEDTVGGGNLDDAGGWFGTPSTDAEWAYELSGLWDVGTSADLSTVAAVSAPMEETAAVSVVQDGENAWEQLLENAAARSVDVSEDGQYIAVGAVQIDDGLDRTGQPGVRLYSDDGELLWSHETAEDITNININVDENIVVAGVDDWSTLVFDLNGNIVWQQEDSPTMTALSGDGSTIVASPPVTGLNASDGSILWESDIEDANLMADPLTISGDGSRVAVSTSDFELFVIDDGQVIWEDENEPGPYYSAVSVDGSTLATMEVDNDAQEADLVGYHLESED